MRITCIYVIKGMIEEDLIAVTICIVPRLDHNAVKECRDRRPYGIAKINTRMEFPFSRNWMYTPSERRCHGKIGCVDADREKQEQEYHCSYGKNFSVHDCPLC